ncbi:bifunctional 2-polyprenyl-6-hydroxyphenol methylase/3-demethylubiquinol 3-O-methyltransferase UbiG [Arthrobacter sp. ISL-69]|uniref:class I SAM-dependent methyltransferase n=1 Tax=Arthrobacter sp. ISL-69 TaxID=2819113 RepID=UPI001BE66919|nr:class I SAM-dependent methyltransferase [Arthrobacter sp. ISL-69]MBT2538477.1 class I SAM-dependent methyltransferase [Arthrobacter sp. ISL-69]
MSAAIMASASHFGQGRREPYAKALAGGSGTVTLRPDRDHHAAHPVNFDVGSWCREASILESSLLQSLQGPLLDIGCGPGRLLAAAQRLGMVALGLDTSAAAVRRAHNRGARALEQSVFAAVPQTGHWEAVILLDGNIGIGGSITTLLRRCAQLISPVGTLLVEVEADDDMDLAYSAVLEDENGNTSEPFQWARTGITGLVARAQRNSWSVTGVQCLQGRVFCRLSPAEPVSSLG